MPNEDVQSQETEALETALPKGVSQDEYEKAERIILSGFENDADKNAIMAAMFEQDIPWEKLGKCYKAVTEAHGLVVKAADVREALVQAIEGLDTLEFESYAALQDTCTDIAAAVNGADDRKVMGAIAKAAKEAEVDLPKKPKAVRGGLNKVKSAVADILAEDPEVSLEDFTKAITPFVKSEVHAEGWAKAWFKLMSGIAQGKKADEINASG